MELEKEWFVSFLLIWGFTGIVLLTVVRAPFLEPLSFAQCLLDLSSWVFGTGVRPVHVAFEISQKTLVELILKAVGFDSLC